MPRKPAQEPAAGAQPIADALATEYEPAGADLVIADPFDRAETIAVIDRHDEQMILQELQGRVLDVMLYSFPAGDGTTATDLSYQGVNECVRVMNASGKVKIRIDPESLTIESVTEDVGNGPEPCWIATVYASEEHTGYGQFGTFVQAKRMYLTAAQARRRKTKMAEKGKPDGVGEDNSVSNPFARQTAINKAQRNALRVMIPEAIRQALIAQYVGDASRIREIEVGAGARTLADLPPALADDRADQQRADIKRVYDLLHDKNPLAVLPAQLYAYTTRAEHSHDELDKLITYLCDKCREIGVNPDA